MADTLYVVVEENNYSESCNCGNGIVQDIYGPYENRDDAELLVEKFEALDVFCHSFKIRTLETKTTHFHESISAPKYSKDLKKRLRRKKML